MYACIVFFSTVRSRARLRITLTSTAHNKRTSGEAQTNAADSSIAHIHCGRKGNRLKTRREREREAKTLSVGIHRVGGKNNLKL